MSTSNNQQSTFSLQSLCKTYDKIEIPVLQRNYAQGRTEEKDLRAAFVSYLVDSLLNNTHVELDFVYGALRNETNVQKSAAFIPLDGQQRLTTLWLLHWFVAAKEGKVGQVAHLLERFEYEARKDALDFCKALLKVSSINKEEAESIKAFLSNQTWFDEAWHKDPTVEGMLTMLQCFADKKELLATDDLFDRIWNTPLFSFYFLPLEDFGMTDELYIRMNARGEQLTDFEHFKSELYKSIQDFGCAGDVKNKMEKAWVESLWVYREKNTYVTDKPFMNYLSFINKMLYYRSSESNKREDVTFQSIAFNRTFYAEDAEHVSFLVFALDALPKLKEIDLEEIFPERSFKTVLKRIIRDGRDSTDEYFVLYAALSYIQNHRDTLSPHHLSNFVRVVRNLIVHTPDNAVREWSRMLPSIDRMAEHEDVYDMLRTQEVKIEGFRARQLEEERFKALVLARNPQIENQLHVMEDHPGFQGGLTNIFEVCLTHAENKEMKLEPDAATNLEWALVVSTYRAYCKMYAADGDNKGNFDCIRGDLINTTIYHYNEWRVWWENNGTSKNSFQRHRSILFLAYCYAQSAIENLDDFLISWERKRVLELYKEANGDLSTIGNPKKQLFLLYVITRRILNQKPDSFFNNGYNFGWLKRENGYFSLFSGIKNSPCERPIFQTYNRQFRYNSGLKDYAALPPELLQGANRNRLFSDLCEWAKSK